MGQALGWVLKKWIVIRNDFANVQDVMEKIQTKVHPLDVEMCKAVRESVSKQEADKIIFSEEERPGMKIKLLNFNTIQLPYVPENPHYKAGCQNERLADMFVNYFHDFDIMCLQEMYGLISGELKEVAIAYGQKAGFFYHATQPLIHPSPQAAYLCDSGLLILSRFPIIDQEFRGFSKLLFDDGEVQRGMLYAKVQIRPGKCLQLYTLHTQCTNYNYAPKYVPVSRELRDRAMHELVHFMETKVDDNSSCILTGDFNILRYPLNPTMLARIFGMNQEFAQYFPIIENEYGCLQEILKNEGKFNVVNCWERDNGSDPDAKCVTFGESYKETQPD